jgi:predicted pyridoxine 5'-phosphate oxidase superfamily flavin-nucleotide-binding protein
VPTIGLLIDIGEVFFHCGKALMRSRLWDPSAQVERSRFPTLGRIIAEQTRAIEVEAAEAIMAEGYRTRLY